MMLLLGPLRAAARPVAQGIGRAAVAQVREVAVMAALAAMAPLGRATGGVERAIDALLPIAAHIAPTARPVLLVHGLGGTKSCWFALARALRKRSMTVDAINYSPFGTSVEQLADQLAARVDRLLAETGADKVHLIGHSLGGIVIAQAFADGRLDGQVDTVVTIATPFGGSPWANLCPLGATVRALRRGSPLLSRLAEAQIPDGVRWLAFTAALDLIVPGRRSVPRHAEVHNVTVDDVGHVGMLLNPLVVDQIVAALPTPEQAVA
jgi:triacylglycerol esterase/lipase EstA (alpha/beta hydrolase family)